MGLKRFIDTHAPLRTLVYRTATRFIVRPYIAALGVPVVAVTGTNGKSTVVKLLNRILLEAGCHVGACCTDGVIHNRTYVTDRDEAGSAGAWRAAHCPEVDVLVLETARGGILDYGTGFGRCDVGVVTNVYEDHLGSFGIETVEQMADVKSAIVRRTAPSGTVVLNADDPLVRIAVNRTAATPIFFTVQGRESELERCWYTKGGGIHRKSVAVEEYFMAIDEIPITLRGVQEFNTANVLAALAALEGLEKKIPMEPETVRRVLRNFGIDPLDNIRRNTLVRYRGEFVLLCQSKNPESLRRDISVVERVKEVCAVDYTVGIMSAPGGRQEKYYRQISKIVSPVCDLFYIRPPAEKYLRGWTGEKIVSLLSSAVPREKIATGSHLPLETIIERTEKRKRRLFIVFMGVTEANFDARTFLAESHPMPLWEMLAE